MRHLTGDMCVVTGVSRVSRVSVWTLEVLISRTMINDWTEERSPQSGACSGLNL